MNWTKQRTLMIVSSQIRSLGVLLACGFAAALAACSTSSVNTIVDNMPSAVGLPADTPERPATPPAYPAVHDMPPPRANATLSAEEQEKLEHDLVAVRARQDAVTGVTSATAKKRPAPAATAPRIIPANNSSNTIY